MAMIFNQPPKLAALGQPALNSLVSAPFHHGSGTSDECTTGHPGVHQLYDSGKDSIPTSASRVMDMDQHDPRLDPMLTESGCTAECAILACAARRRKAAAALAPGGERLHGYQDAGRAEDPHAQLHTNSGDLPGHAGEGQRRGDPQPRSSVPMALVSWTWKLKRKAVGSNDAEVQSILEAEDQNFRVRLLWSELHGVGPRPSKC